MTTEDEDEFACCGGNDKYPQEHCQDCPDRPVSTSYGRDVRVERFMGDGSRKVFTPTRTENPNRLVPAVWVSDDQLVLGVDYNYFANTNSVRLERAPDPRAEIRVVFRVDSAREARVVRDGGTRDLAEGTRLVTGPDGRLRPATPDGSGGLVVGVAVPAWAEELARSSGDDEVPEAVVMTDRDWEPPLRRQARRARELAGAIPPARPVIFQSDWLRAPPGAVVIRQHGLGEMPNRLGVEVRHRSGQVSYYRTAPPFVEVNSVDVRVDGSRLAGRLVDAVRIRAEVVDPRARPRVSAIDAADAAAYAAEISSYPEASSVAAARDDLVDTLANLSRYIGAPYDGFRGRPPASPPMVVDDPFGPATREAALAALERVRPAGVDRDAFLRDLLGSDSTGRRSPEGRGAGFEPDPPKPPDLRPGIRKLRR